MASVRLEGVYKRYGDAAVVHDVNLDIEDGDFVVLVGPSGCGKSTTLRMIAGLEEISAGTLYIDGKVVNTVSPRDRDVAMVFQSYALYPQMSVRENISFGLRLRKVSAAEIAKRVAEVAEIIGLDELLDRRPKQLSGGQRQRVAMGRAIVRQPAVFLFDEPLSNLDAKLRVQMRAEIAKLHQRLGTTTVYVTHDQVEAMTLARRIVVMNRGVIQQVGAPLELYRRPANAFVAGFIGSPAMNFFDVRCEAGEAGDAGPMLRGQGVDLPVPEHFRDRLGEPGHALVVGIRPEDMFESADEAHPLRARVEVLEPLGAEVHALCDVDGQPLTVRLDPYTSAGVGDTLTLRVALDALHLFDRESGASLRDHG